MHSELCMCSVPFSILTCVNFQNWLQFQEQYYLNKTHKYRKIFFANMAEVMPQFTLACLEHSLCETFLVAFMYL